MPTRHAELFVALLQILFLIQDSEIVTKKNFPDNSFFKHIVVCLALSLYRLSLIFLNEFLDSFLKYRLTLNI